MSAASDDEAHRGAVSCGWRVLGEVTVEIGDTTGSLTGQRQRAVLGFLILHPNSSVAVNQLIEALWAGEPPMTARNSVQRFIADIRQRLGPAAHRLQTTSDGYRLEILEGESDINRARRALGLGRDRMLTGDAAAASTRFSAGLTEFRGQPLAGVGDVWFRVAANDELDELYRSLREGRFEAELALGRHGRMMEELRRFANANPHRESAWTLLMIALYRSGRQHDALDAAKQLRRSLLDDLGIDPSPTIIELIHRILTHAGDLRLDHHQRDNDELPITIWRAPLPSQLVRVLTGQIVGRTEEIDSGIESIAQLDSGTPQVTFISGEPGIGKTRLAAELAQRCDHDEAVILYGRSDEDAAVPLGAWAEVLADLITTNRDLIDGLDIESLDLDLGVHIPELHSNGPAVRSPNDPEVRRASMFRTVVRLLDGVAAAGPVVIVLDDLQWAEDSTVQLVRHVARSVRGPVWLIGLYRDTDIDEHDLLTDVVATLRTEPHVVVHHLGGLDDAATIELVNALLPDADPTNVSDFARTVRSETSGNPFFMSEIVRNLIESRPDDTDGATQLPLDQASLPDSVRQVIRQRVARLGEEAAQTLSTASLLGRHFELRDLADVLEVDEDRVLADLESALDAALVSEAPGRADLFSFEHDLVHHSLYADISESRRRRLHARAGLALTQRMARSRRTERAGEIAGHFVNARDPALAVETITALRSAADEAARRHVPDEAAALLDQALRLLNDDGFGDEAIDAEQLAGMRIELLVERGTQLRNAGRPEYRNVLLLAGHAAEEANDVDAMAAAALANTRGLQTNVWEVDQERVRQLEAAVAAIGMERSARRANLLASLASEKWQDEHRAESAVHRADSIALARQVGDPETLANVLARAGRARNTITPPDELRRLSVEMQELALVGDDFDPYLMINLLRTIQNQSLRDADPELLASTSAHIRAYAETRPLAACQRAVALTDVLLAGLRGDGAEHLRLADIAFALSIEMGDPETTIAYEGHLFYGLHLLGRESEVLGQIIDVANSRPDQDTYQAVLANVLHFVGRNDEATDIVTTALAIGFGLGIDDYAVQSLQLWADAAAGVQHLDACREILELLQPHAGRLAGHVVNVCQPVDLSLGRLHRVLGQHDAALAHLDASADIAQRFDATWMSEQTDLARAAVLVDLGQVDDARNLLGDVAVRANKNHHPGLVANAKSALSTLG